jgi:hypothetical protein
MNFMNEGRFSLNCSHERTDKKLMMKTDAFCPLFQLQEMQFAGSRDDRPVDGSYMKIYVWSSREKLCKSST